MAARLLDGVAVANQIRSEVAPAVAAFAARAGRPPGLGIVLVARTRVGDLRPRQTQVSGGRRAARRSRAAPATASLQDLLGVVRRLNASDVHDGILVQSPLPAAMARMPSGRSSTRSIPRRTSTGSTR